MGRKPVECCPLRVARGFSIMPVDSLFERGFMRNFAVLFFTLVITGAALAQNAEADSLVRTGITQFMEALQTGDGDAAAAMFSSQAVAQVEVMLNTIKQSLDRDPQGTMRRLNNAGYLIDLEGAEDWEPEVYLAQTLSLPMISARYVPSELEIDSVAIDDESATVQMTFRTASGTEIPQQALMTLENDVWKVTSFMGITAFP